MKLKDWLRDVRGKQPPEEVYVDFSALPAEPEGPYRARVTEGTRRSSSAGIDVKEREVVAGELQLLYRTRCPCGQQWDSAEFQRVAICGGCGRAVIVEPPPAPPA